MYWFSPYICTPPKSTHSCSENTGLFWIKFHWASKVTVKSDLPKNYRNNLPAASCHNIQCTTVSWAQWKCYPIAKSTCGARQIKSFQESKKWHLIATFNQLKKCGRMQNVAQHSISTFAWHWHRGQYILVYYNTSVYHNTYWTIIINVEWCCQLEYYYLDGWK